MDDTEPPAPLPPAPRATATLTFVDAKKPVAKRYKNETHKAQGQYIESLQIKKRIQSALKTK